MGRLPSRSPIWEMRTVTWVTQRKDATYWSGLCASMNESTDQTTARLLSRSPIWEVRTVNWVTQRKNATCWSGLCISLNESTDQTTHSRYEFENASKANKQKLRWF